MTDITGIFKAYDIRGKVGTELTSDVAERVGQALANWLPQQGTVAVGRDMRPDSAELATAVIKGLRAQGRDVLDIGLVTTDMIYFAVGHFNLAGGAMVTASHNPGDDNGIKLCREEAKPIGLDGGLQEIRDAVLANSFTAAPTPGQLEHKEIVEDWIQHVLSFIDVNKLKPMKIAADAGNGMAGKIIPELEPYVPFEITEMYFELDGTFPNHLANPLKFETLTDMIARIKADKLDGGMAFDGDGDRAFLVDETGEVLTASVMTAMLSEYFLQQFPGSHIIYDVRCSHTVPEVIQAAGGTPVRERVGHSFIKATMRKTDAPFGGEGSGHFYFRDNWYADSGLITAVIGLYVAGQSGLTLSELRQKYTHYVTSPEINFTVKDKATAIERLKKAFSNNQQDTLDGLTVTINNTDWFNVRTSNTEPLLRLNAEAGSAEELDRIVTEVSKLVDE